MKLTPIQLAQAPIRIAVDTEPYDLSTQRRLGMNHAMAVTYGGTQTFNNQGKPIDKDND